MFSFIFLFYGVLNDLNFSSVENMHLKLCYQIWWNPVREAVLPSVSHCHFPPFSLATVMALRLHVIPFPCYQLLSFWDCLFFLQTYNVMKHIRMRKRSQTFFRNTDIADWWVHCGNHLDSLIKEDVLNSAFCLKKAIEGEPIIGNYELKEL